MLIECADLWKIFGESPGEALAAARAGATRDELMEKWQCVLAVAGVSLSVEEGEVFVVMGLSGSGKSTLVRHLNRLVEPTAGRVRIDGQDINDLDADALRALRSEKIGMVFQHVALLPHRSVIDNVAFGLELRRVAKAERHRIARQTLELVSLDGWENRMPSELSGGMKQRVGLARALVANPRILLLDEPFAALDPLIRRQLQAEFLRLTRELDKTTVFITHDLEEALHVGDRIALMRDGKVVQLGTPEEIVTEPADDYVAEFVRGVSGLSALTAQSIAYSAGENLSTERSSGGPSAASGSWPRVEASTPLSELLQISSANETPLVVVSQGEPIGTVSHADLLRALSLQYDRSASGQQVSESP